MLYKVSRLKSKPRRYRQPKEALFGGVRRARISSQSAKRAMRVSDVFKDAVKVPTGTRTKKLVKHLADKLELTGIDREWAENHALEIAKDLYAKMDRRSELETSVLLYISEKEIDEILRFLTEAQENATEPDIKTFGKQLAKQLEKRTSAPDIALFGRMLAENPELNIDAACQVAHAISTHEVNTASSTILPPSTISHPRIPAVPVCWAWCPSTPQRTTVAAELTGSSSSRTWAEMPISPARLSALSCELSLSSCLLA